MAFVYILRCRDGSFYVGSARDTLERRVAEHNAGAYAGYTSSRRPVDYGDVAALRSLSRRGRGGPHPS